MNKKNIFNEILSKIGTTTKSNILIGIDGGQGSGKTHFIESLKKEILRQSNYWVENIETDDFLIERNKRENLPTDFFKDKNNLSKLFDFKKFVKIVKLLAKTKNNDIKITGLYNRKTGNKDRDEIKHLKDKNIIIVGGPYLLSSTLPKFDLKIFLDVTEKNRLKNTLQRVANNKSRTLASQKKLFKKFEHFFDKYYTNKLSGYNLILNNNNFKKIKIMK
jgi:uridine kinase